MSSELAALGADTANQQAGGPSFFDRAAMFTGSAVLSGLTSIYNTFVEYGGGSESSMLDTSRILETYDRDWYNYYKENKQLADVGGFVVTSFLPGGLAIKGLKLAQAGRSAGAIGRAVSGPLNFFASKRDEYLERGLREIASEGGTAFAYVNSNKLASMAWGVADNVLTNAAFEAGVLLTMNNSPILADASNSDILKDFAFGAFVGGGFGGALDAIATQRVFKDAVKQLGLKQRGYDTPANFSNLGLGIGDEAFGFVDSLLALPKEIRESDSFLTVKNPLRKGDQWTFDVSETLKKQLDKTGKEQVDNILSTLNKLGTKETPEVGQAMADFVMSTVKKMQAGGAPDAAIKEEVGSYLLGLKTVRTLRDTTPLNTSDVNEVFYINNSVDLSKLAGNENNIEEFLKLATSRTPFAKNATAKPYKITGDMAQLKITASARLFDEAWEGGFDIAIIGDKMRVNPKSKIVEQITDPTLVPSRYLNTRTSAVSDEVVATWADLLPVGMKASDSLLKDGVLNGKGVVLRVADNINPKDVVEATARHAWASGLSEKDLVGAVIDINDISRMDLLASGKFNIKELGASVKLLDGTEFNAASLDLTQKILETKLSKLEELFTLAEVSGSKFDIRELAYMLNTTEDWVERAIANGFKSSDDLKEGVRRELSDYLKRENFLATWASPRSFVDLGVASEETIKAAETAATSKGAKYVDTFVTGELGFKQRVDLLTQGHKNAFHAVLGEDANNFLDVDPRNAIRMADELGTGAGLVSFSNANYGDVLKLWAQHTGKLTHQAIQKVVNENLNRIQPFIDQFRNDPKAGAELGIILTMLRRSSDKFVLVQSPNGRQSLAIRELTRVDHATGQRYIDGSKLDEWTKQNGSKPGAKAFYEIDSDKVVSFLNVWKDINATRIDKRKVLMTSRGQTIGWDPETIYAPPIDTTRFPYFAYVKIRDGHVASTSDVAMITARSDEELSKLIREVPSEYEVFTKKDTERYYQIKQIYDAQLTLNEPRVDSMLRKQGKLSDFFYEVRPENVMEDFIRYSQAADSALVRQAVDTRYAQLITELQALGKQYTNVATSQMTGLSKAFDKTVVNPFDDYVKTALDISKRSTFPLVQQLNEFVDSAGTQAYRILVSNREKAQQGTISWQEAEEIATRYGVGGVYNAENAETAFKIANRPADRNLIRETVSKVNMFLATVGLRLDMANSIVNTISMPIMLGSELASLRSLAKSNPEAIGALSKLTTVSPDGTIAVPSYTKIIGNAIKNVIGPGSKELLESYRASGDVKNVVLQFHEMLGELAVDPRLSPSAWKQKVDNAVEVASKWTGNTWSEDFTRAVSANVMDQLTAPLVANKVLTSQEAAAYRSVFVNRVNGNYIASQRPILFQGTVGAAVSLFQTYVFNVMQQLVRHIENRDMRAAMTMVGLQGSIYGLNGIPFFEAVNTHLIGNANINDGHRDVYSMTTQLAGKELGDWLLYGTASAFPLFSDKMPALYTRGDINPRHVSILPISPLDVPAVDVGIRVAKNIGDIAGKIAAGSGVAPALLEGLEHNGVSRPLAGFAQLIQGYSSTSKGTLISAANDFDLVTASTRMIGAKPTDESILMNTMYRQNAYRAADMDRLSRLGEVVKTKLRNNQMPDTEELQEFMKKYASAGGNITNYASALQRWSRDANMSIVNQMKYFHQSNYAQRLSEIMSGTTLDDFISAQQEQTTQ